MTTTNLKTARELELPTRDEVLRRDFTVKKFWESNRETLSEAWKEWEASESVRLNSPPKTFIDKGLRSVVQEAWNNPETEQRVKDLLKEVSPDVFVFQFFSPEKIKELRGYLSKVEEAQIPLKPPYGIVLNRKGIMLDQRSEGYLAAPSFQSLYREIFDQYMRPIARLLFPEVTGFDTQTFGFSIQYKPEKDTSIRMHTDASAVTLNINLNLPEEEYTGSEVDFQDPLTGKINRVRFSPGSAMIHKGNVAHAAQPITSGERNNLVLWLYGDRMQIPRYFESNVKIDPKLRWAKSTQEYDDYAPF